MNSLLNTTVLASILLTGCGAYGTGLSPLSTAGTALRASQASASFREVLPYESVHAQAQQAVSQWVSGHPFTETFGSGTWPVAGISLVDLKIRPDGSQGFDAAGDAVFFARSHVFGQNSLDAAFRLHLDATGHVTRFTYEKGQQDHTPATAAPRFRTLGSAEAKPVIELFEALTHDPTWGKDTLTEFFSNDKLLSLLSTGESTTEDPAIGFTEHDTLDQLQAQRLTIAEGQVVKLTFTWTSTYKTGYHQTATSETSALLLDSNGKILKLFPHPHL